VIARLPVPVAVEPRIAAAPTLTPFIKWPGGKSDELASIAALAPTLTGRLIDPFVGGGSVVLATPLEVPAWANDSCADLVRLYLLAADSDQAARAALDRLASAWDGFSGWQDVYRELGRAFVAGETPSVGRLLRGPIGRLPAPVESAGQGLLETWSARLERDLPTKLGRMRRVQAAVGEPLSEPDLLANIEGAVRAAFYMAVRCRYNEARVRDRWDAERAADFLFLRELGYAAMFRYNSRNEFNVPYGGVTYNRKSLADKVALMFSPGWVARIRATQWRSTDFELFLAEAGPTADDFVFVDPPYDSEFNAYDNRPFDWHDQRRLRDVLESMRAKVMVVVKDTPMIRALYGSDRWAVTESAKTYAWTIKSRNDRKATHLAITSY
jgi:DNA adenine methylase